MYLMYYDDEEGNRVYTLKVRARRLCSRCTALLYCAPAALNTPSQIPAPHKHPPPLPPTDRAEGRPRRHPHQERPPGAVLPRRQVFPGARDPEEALRHPAHAAAGAGALSGVLPCSISDFCL
jgi:hypothetical protein